VKAIDTNPKSIRIVSPKEIVILEMLKTKIGETEGIINICIPSSTIEPVMEKLSDWYWIKNPDNKPAAEKPSEEKSEHIPKENEKKNFRFFDYLNRVDPVILLELFLKEKLIS